MEKVLLKAEKRTEIGKGAARRLRRGGMLPGVVYSGGESIPIKLQKKEMVRLINSGIGEHTLITIQLNDDNTKVSEHPVLIKDYQTDPVTDEFLHVDFMEISLKDKVKITVPLAIIKEPIGVKKGGILQYHVREVEIECLPTQIPDKIEVDASFIEIGHSLHVSDLKPPTGVKILTDPQEVILSVTAPVVEETAPPTPPEEEVVEPELVKAKGKEEEEEPKE